MKTLLFFLLLLTTACFAQPTINNYTGGWAGTFPEINPFSFDLELSETKDNIYQLKFIGKQSTNLIELNDLDGSKQMYSGSFNNQIEVKVNRKSGRPIVFIKMGHHLCHIPFSKSANGWKAKWQVFLSTTIPPTLYMSLNQNEENYNASLFFKEPTMHYLFGQNLGFNEKEFSFNDIRSMVNFTGTFDQENISLKLQFLNEKMTIPMQRLDYDNWTIGNPSGKSEELMTTIVPNPKFDSLVADILSDSLERTHSVLVAKDGEMIFEKYFDGFNENTPHDTRSAAKSFAGTMIGISIDDGIIENEQALMKPYFDQTYPDIDWSNGKEAIQLHHLLTMSTGLDAIDFGLNRNSYANENTYQNQPDWTKHILEAPMVLPVGQEGNYGSGSPHLLGPIISTQLAQPLEFYIHEKLFAPIGVVNYRFQTTNIGEPYFGGGWYFTPRDLIKFGQLLLNDGMANGQQVVAADWVKKSMAKHTTLENTQDKNKYGYFLWHKTYELGNRKIASVEGRGAGGQYFFVVPELKIVSVITSGNYANNKGFQPERIFSEYLLPKLLD